MFGMVALSAIVAAMLWALGLPLWHSYSTEHHVADALNHVAVAKLAVMEAATIKGGFAQVRSNDLQYSARVSGGPYVSRVDIADGGLITLMTRNTGAHPDPVLVFTPLPSRGSTGDIIWNCQVFLGDSSLVPASCQNQPIPSYTVVPVSTRGATVSLIP
ncbi:hypothetical protein HY57_10100 [Dyella japonica A8]|uniref:Uncharacterized protein n=1 Tax=Dyella japonica A8 TaxID=1217721 RepID=A0A075K5Z7_9GAMM|nr:hypothetical protein HY57_10100 [Dyella japonica A8]